MKNEIYKDYEFDEEDDIILPQTVIGELVYICFILSDIIKTKDNRAKKWFELKRQIHFFIRWKRN